MKNLTNTLIKIDENFEASLEKPSVLIISSLLTTGFAIWALWIVAALYFM